MQEWLTVQKELQALDRSYQICERGYRGALASGRFVLKSRAVRLQDEFVHFASEVPENVVLNRSEQMIEWAHRRAREHGVEDRVTLLVAGATALPFEDGRFDAALTYTEGVTRGLFRVDPLYAERYVLQYGSRLPGDT